MGGSFKPARGEARLADAVLSERHGARGAGAARGDQQLSQQRAADARTGGAVVGCCQLRRVVDSGTARGCVLSHTHPRAVNLRIARSRDLGTSGSAAAMANAAATAAAACQHDDRRTVSCVLHTPEAECNALPFELGTRNAQRPRISGSNGRASASGGFTLHMVHSCLHSLSGSGSCAHR